MVNDSRYDAILHSETWKFDDAVSECFDNMLERSIPSYIRMRDLVFSFGREFVKENTTIVDIGCSLGNSMAPFIDLFSNRCNYIGIDPSEAMANRATERFKKYISDGVLKIIPKKIENYEIKSENSVVLSVLSLQFIPPELRQNVVDSVYNSLISHGAFILVEKTRLKSNDIAQLYEDIYYDLKRKHGYTDEQIFAKKECLKNVLIPYTRQENETMLRHAGFSTIECFWTDIMFSAWIAIKE